MNEILREWNKNSSERVKLQYAYAILALASLVIAGLASLLNRELGYGILSIAFGLTVIFFANAIGWVLLEAFVLKRISKKPASRK